MRQTASCIRFLSLRSIALAITCAALTTCALSFTGLAPAFADIADDSSGITRDDVVQGPENSWRFEDGERIEAPDDEAASALDTQSGIKILTANDSVGMGIDVSQYQGKINWEKVKASGVTFAIIRCGYGSEWDTSDNMITSASSKATRSKSQDDPWFEYNASECERLKIPYGVYIYSYATSNDMVKSEAVHAYRLIKGHHLSLPIYIDMEDASTQNLGSAKLSEMARVFCATMNKTAYKPGIYANLHWWNNYLTDPSLNSYEHWVAQWSNGCSYSGKYRVWQYSSSVKVSGISSGGVDANYLMYKTSIASCSATLSSQTFVYSGEENRPSVSVKYGKRSFRRNVDYRLVYENSTNVGTATVTAKGMGVYRGSLTAEYVINPRPTAITELKAGSAKFRVDWKKRTKQSSGYQVRYWSRDDKSDMAKETVKSDQTTTLLVRGLKHKRTYNVQVRTYARVDGKVYYSSWSKRQAIKTK